MFFKQKFKIFYDNGNIVEVDDLIGYIGCTDCSAQAFYQRMKFTFKVDKRSFWSYSNISDMIPTFFLYTENNVMISPELFKGEYLKYRNKKKENLVQYFIFNESSSQSYYYL